MRVRARARARGRVWIHFRFGSGAWPLRSWLGPNPPDAVAPSSTPRTSPSTHPIPLWARRTRSAESKAPPPYGRAAICRRRKQPASHHHLVASEKRRQAVGKVVSGLCEIMEMGCTERMESYLLMSGRSGIRASDGFLSCSLAMTRHPVILTDFVRFL